MVNSEMNFEKLCFDCLRQGALVVASVVLAAMSWPGLVTLTIDARRCNELCCHCSKLVVPL